MQKCTRKSIPSCKQLVSSSALGMTKIFPFILQVRRTPSGHQHLLFNNFIIPSWDEDMVSPLGCLHLCETVVWDRKILKVYLLQVLALVLIIFGPLEKFLNPSVPIQEVRDNKICILGLLWEPNKISCMSA